MFALGKIARPRHAGVCDRSVLDLVEPRLGPIRTAPDASRSRAQSSFAANPLQRRSDRGSVVAFGAMTTSATRGLWIVTANSSGDVAAVPDTSSAARAANIANGAPVDVAFDPTLQLGLRRRSLVQPARATVAAARPSLRNKRSDADATKASAPSRVL